MKKSLSSLILVFLFLNQSHAQVIISTSEAVTIASRQRMLSQKMAKDKVYLTAKKNINNAEKELRRTIYTFQNDLKILKDFAPTEVIKQKIEAEEHAFEFYKKQILDDSKKSLNSIIHTNTLFLKVCDDVVAEILVYAKTEIDNSSKTIPKTSVAAGNLKYLAQRLNLYYILNEFNFENVSSDEIETIVSTIDKNLNYLTVLEGNTLKIDEEINEIRSDWINLKKEIYTDNHVDLKHKKINSNKLHKICNSIVYKTNVTEKMYSEINPS